MRRSLIEPSSARASLAKSRARAIGSPWKLPPVITRPPPVASASSVGDAALGEDERVVGRAVDLDVEDAPEVVERVADGAVDLGHAAQRVRVLDLVGRRRGGPLERRVAQEVAQLGRDRDLARMRPGELVRRGERHVRPEQRLDADIAAATLAVRASRSASASSSAPIAVISCVPLRSARPSFASSVSGSRPTSRERDRAAGIDCPPNSTCAAPDQRQREVGERGEVAGRPDGALGRHDRVDAEREEREQAIDELGPAAAVAEGEGVRPQQEHRPDDLARRTARRRRPHGSSGGSPGAAPRRPGR